MSEYPDYYLVQNPYSDTVEYELEFTPAEDDSEAAPARRVANFRERDLGGAYTIACNREDHIDLLCYYWNLLRDGTGSPIERKLADALMRRCTLDDQWYPFVVGKGDKWRTKSGFSIAPQVQIGPYRADFVIALCRTEDHPGGLYSAMECPHGFEACLVVECDGHEWHERTKEQAARDKKRDRYLLQEGYPVVRFTGSEIVADPSGCAGQIITALKAIIGRQMSDTADMRRGLQREWAKDKNSPWHGWKAITA